MSAAKPSAARSPIVYYGIAGALVLIIAVTSYFLFVVRESNRAAKAATIADRLTKQVQKAQDYIESHKAISDQKKKIEEETIKVQLAIPRGPIDITVGSYLDKKAQECGIEDLKWSFLGGIKPPASDKDDGDRLSVEPTALKSSSIDVQFSGRYKDVLKFIRTLSPEEGMAPWPIEIMQLDMRRAPPGTTTKGPRVNVIMSVRYFHQ